MWTAAQFAGRLKTGVLGADVTEAMVRQAVADVRAFPIAAYAVDMPFLRLAKQLLDGTGIMLTAVVGYPWGGMTVGTKLDQVRFARAVGCDEINPSLDFGAIKSREEGTIDRELGSLRDAVMGTVDVIPIAQFHILTNDEKLWITERILRSGIRGVKTNGRGGACLVEDITLIKREFGDDVFLEASGGIRESLAAIHLLELGASFIHSSSGYEMMRGLAERERGRGVQDASADSTSG